MGDWRVKPVGGESRRRKEMCPLVWCQQHANTEGWWGTEAVPTWECYCFVCHYLFPFERLPPSEHWTSAMQDAVGYIAYLIPRTINESPLWIPCLVEWCSQNLQSIMQICIKMPFPLFIGTLLPKPFWEKYFSYLLFLLKHLKHCFFSWTLFPKLFREK